MERLDGRMSDELRPVRIERGYIMHPEGSVLVSFGQTKVICNATVDESVPVFKKGSGEGWITAEYAMLPRSTQSRNARDISRLRQNPRSVEIQRLIGRALRAAVDLKLLGERSIVIDCDVIQADGGTRTASVTGGFIALYDACAMLVQKGLVRKNPVIHLISAVSAGVVGGEVLLDLCYEEDSRAEADMNIVMASDGGFVEVQGTGEKATFSSEQLQKMLAYAEKGNQKLMELQRNVLRI